MTTAPALATFKTAHVSVVSDNAVCVVLSCHYQDVAGNLEAETLYNALPMIFNTESLGNLGNEHDDRMHYAAEHPGIMARSMAALFNALGYQTRTA